MKYCVYGIFKIKWKRILLFKKMIKDLQTNSDTT